MAQLPEPVRKLFEQPNFGHLATVMPDGSPHVTTVWVDTDGEHILVNTTEGRQKPRNAQRDSRVALDIYDQSNPYRQATIRGNIVEMTTDGADAHIDRLAKKYLGKDTYPFRQPGERRVVLKIAPTRIASQGLES
jgi:PPOX class probable F420-dependent enzyme